jgi:hypothetical protein
MFRLSSFLLGLVLALQSSAITIKPAVIDVFDLRPETPDSLKAMSFANWFNATSADYPYTKTLYATVGLDLDQLLEQFDLPTTRSGMESMRREFDFYTEQQATFKSKVEKYVQSIIPGMIAKIEATFQNSDIDLVVYRTADPYEFLLGLRARPELKAKLSKINVGTANALPTWPLKFYNKRGKSKKVVLLGDFVFQSFGRTDDAMVSIKVVCGDLSRVLTLNPITHPKPYIKKFFSSNTETEEGEHIALTWEVLGASKVSLDNSIGEKAAKWQMNISPLSSTVYTLTAENEYGSSTSEVSIKVERSVLRSAKITYFCPEKGDPKLKGTSVNISLYDVNGNQVATFTNAADLEFSGKVAYNGPFELKWNDVVYKRDLKKGKFIVKIEGTNQDKWTFSPILILDYSDGSKNQLYGYGNKEIEVGKDGAVFEF